MLKVQTNFNGYKYKKHNLPVFNNFTAKWGMKNIGLKKTADISELVRDFTDEGRSNLLHFYRLVKHQKIELKDKNEYYKALLFNLVYPRNKKEKELVQKMSDNLKNSMSVNLDEAEGYLNSGLPGTPIEASFSFQMTFWILNSSLVNCENMYSTCHKSTQMELIFPFLNKAQQEYISEENLNWKDWCKYLQLNESNYLKSILSIIHNYDADIAFKETIFKRLQVYIRFSAKEFQPPGGVLVKHQYYERLSKGIKLNEYIEANKFIELKLEKEQVEKVVNAARINLLNLCRETDPITNADVLKTRVFLKNETVICLFFLKKEFQLKYQRYVGYMLFKNQLPVAYGGGWVLKKQIRFGLNILPFGRGGESQKILADLVSCYKNLFKPHLFLIDAYQIGKNNPEAILSGAFWFYYKLGFRSVNKEINLIAQQEYELFIGNKTYKSTPKTLKKLSNYPIYLGYKKNALDYLIDISVLK